MATVGSIGRRLSFIIKSVPPVRFFNTALGTNYSIFPKYYIKPVYNKAKQAELVESGEAEKIAHVPILPAFVYNTSSEFHDETVEKFTNFIMRKGKKELARGILEKTFENIKRAQLQRYHRAKPENRSTIELDPVKILHKAIFNVTPVMELMRMKKGGAVYQVPVPVLESRQRFLAMNWLIRAAKENKPTTKTPLTDTLAKELIDASYNEGRVVKKKQDLHKQCEANRAYAHFRWA